MELLGARRRRNEIINWCGNGADSPLMACTTVKWHCINLSISIVNKPGDHVKKRDINADCSSIFIVLIIDSLTYSVTRYDRQKSAAAYQMDNAPRDVACVLRLRAGTHRFLLSSHLFCVSVLYFLLYISHRPNETLWSETWWSYLHIIKTGIEKWIRMFLFLVLIKLLEFDIQV